MTLPPVVPEVIPGVGSSRAAESVRIGYSPPLRRLPTIRILEV